MVFQDKLAWTICRNYTTGTINKKRTSLNTFQIFFKNVLRIDVLTMTVIFLFMDQMDKMKLKKKTGHVNTVF
jgi:hypothetical protein